MDAQTKKTLADITNHIPLRLARNVTKRVVDTSEEDLARAALRSPGISMAKKNYLAKLIERGMLRREETVVNESVVKELDKYHTEKIAEARRKGLLEDPRKDPFIQKRQARVDAHK